MSDQVRNTLDKTKILQAWVIFSGQTDMAWLRIFRPGFRHCYVLLNDGDHWMSLDPLSNYTDVSIHHLPQEFNLPLWLKDRGHTVVKAPVERIKKQAPWMPFTCVEAVKRVIGLHSCKIFTPWQLYRHLTKIKVKTLSYKHKGDFVWEV